MKFSAVILFSVVLSASSSMAFDEPAATPTKPKKDPVNCSSGKDYVFSGERGAVNTFNTGSLKIKGEKAPRTFSCKSPDLYADGGGFADKPSVTLDCSETSGGRTYVVRIIQGGHIVRRRGSVSVKSSVAGDPSKHLASLTCK